MNACVFRIKMTREVTFAAANNNTAAINGVNLAQFAHVGTSAFPEMCIKDLR